MNSRRVPPRTKFKAVNLGLLARLGCPIKRAIYATYRHSNKPRLPSPHAGEGLGVRGTPHTVDGDLRRRSSFKRAPSVCLIHSPTFLTNSVGAFSTIPFGNRNTR